MHFHHFSAIFNLALQISKLLCCHLGTSHGCDDLVRRAPCEPGVMVTVISASTISGLGGVSKGDFPISLNDNDHKMVILSG